jgi:hypothetical protein
MENVVDELAVLKNALDLESMLRSAANTEWARGLTGGLMQKAHEASLEIVLQAAKELISRSTTA